MAECAETNGNNPKRMKLSEKDSNDLSADADSNNSDIEDLNTAERETCQEKTAVNKNLDPDWIFKMQNKNRKVNRDVRCCASKDDVSNDSSITTHYHMICQVGPIVGLDHSFRHFSDIPHCNKRLEIVNRDAVSLEDDSSDNLVHNYPIQNNHVDWYKIDEYFCGLCKLIFKTEYEFVNHTVQLVPHGNRVEAAESSHLELIHNSCSTCLMFLYGDSSVQDDHFASPEHQLHSYEIQDSTELLKRYDEFKKLWSETYENWRNNLNENTFRDRQLVLFDLKDVIRNDFPAAEACFLGPQIFLDFRLRKGLCNGSISDLHETVVRRMEDHKELWKNISYNTQQSMFSITACHCKSDRYVEILFEYKMTVTPEELKSSLLNTNFLFYNAVEKIETMLKCYNQHFNVQHSFDFILFTMIFYMQSKSMFPKILNLIEYQNETYFKRDWEMNVNVSCTPLYLLKEKWNLQIDYCRFYANFDYQREVICPWIGETVKKWNFVNDQRMPKEMNFKFDSEGPHLGEFDAPFCIQDPFGQMINITKNVSKAELRAFRNFCLFIVGYFSQPKD